MRWPTAACSRPSPPEPCRDGRADHLPRLRLLGQTERVGTEHVRRVPGQRTWISTFLVDRTGERLVIPYADPSRDTDAGVSVAAALDSIADELDAAVVGVTCGAEGALVRERGDRAILRVPTIAIQARDTLNAGDVWHGAYAFGLVRGWSTERRVRFANVAAAIKCERFGGRVGAPGLAEAMDRLAAFS